jgi:hypothetical protein
MAGIRGHAERSVRAGAALSGEAHHPRTARRAVRLVTGIGADRGAGRAGDRPRVTRVSGRRAGASRRAGDAGSVAANFVLPANGPVRLRLLRVRAGRDPRPRTGRLPQVTGVGGRAGAAGRTGGGVRPAIRRAPRRAAFSSSSPSAPHGRRATRARRDDRAIPGERLVPKAAAEAPTPEDHRHQHQSSKHLLSPFAQNRRLQSSPRPARSGTQAKAVAPPACSVAPTCPDDEKTNSSEDAAVSAPAATKPTIESVSAES